jgi:hypothetical protein
MKPSANLDYTGNFSIELYSGIETNFLPEDVIFDKESNVIIAKEGKVYQSAGGIQFESHSEKPFVFRYDDIKIIRDVEKNVLWKNWNYKLADQLLKGQPLIGEFLAITHTDDLCFGEVTPRECKYCLARHYKGKKVDDCTFSEKPAKKMFGDPNEKLPEVIDGFEIGNFCPYFCHFLNE